MSVWAWLPGPGVLVPAAPDFPGMWSPAGYGLVAWFPNVWKKVCFLSQCQVLFWATPFSYAMSIQFLLILGGLGPCLESCAEAGPALERAGSVCARKGEGRGAGARVLSGPHFSPCLKGLSVSITLHGSKGLRNASWSPIGS